MKKISKFHNNNSNTIYSLNYKFDSISVAGKFSGTALELIKKYNELAKEAHSNGNYVEMEVFRQYAEHYRKIVTEINERKNQNRENTTTSKEISNNVESSENSEITVAANGLVETEAAPQTMETTEIKEETPTKPQRQIRKRRNFTVVTEEEIQPKETDDSVEETVQTEVENAEKPRHRVLSRKPRTTKLKENTNE
ncbi:MAG: DUF4167 domain-containing protein [Alphaproteobacteria bacterium]|nr:DUF4167 domain-containing protein [Alphaproteobacteria bacterium]